VSGRVASLVLGGLFVAAALGVVAAWFLRTPVPRPNVVLVLIDTLRADHLSAYGYDRATSPFLDGLAADGVRFAQVASVAPTTFPSVSSLLTGRSPVAFYNGRARDEGIPAEFDTLAEMFRAVGYRTAAVSGNPIVRRHPQDDRGFDQGFDVFDESCSAPEEETWHNTWCVTHEALRLVDGFGEAPFFLYVHYLDPHHPYMPPAKWNRFAEAYEGPRFIERGFTGPIMWWLYQGAEDPGVDLRDIQHLRDLYDGEIRSVDANIERLMNELAERGLRDGTLFVFTSDHGESIMEHRQMGHGNSLYQTELHVPLIFYWPQRLDQAEVRSELVCSTDVLPSILELVGLPIPDGLDGVSLFGTRPGRGGRERSCLSLAGSFETMRPSIVSLRKGSTKVIHDRRTDTYEMYDLEADPGELENVAGADAAKTDPAFTTLKESLRRQITPLDRDDGGSAGPMDPEVERALRALGYIQ
jgi:arylsulfatase A-like enzyme